MSEYFCKYCREEDEDSMEDMIFEEILNFGVLGELEVDVHIYANAKTMVLDINRVNAVVGIEEANKGVERKLRVNYCPFCGRKL